MKYYNLNNHCSVIIIDFHPMVKGFWTKESVLVVTKIFLINFLNQENVMWL